MSLARRYETEGRRKGLTVAEWEKLHGLPPYSVYPEARNARRFGDRGLFMYRNATDEERAELDAARGRLRVERTPEEEAARKEARRAYLRAWEAKNRRGRTAA